jgi:DUF4097 and DUF4098 domain-containing protein YvlB
MAQEKWLVDGAKVIDVELVRKLKVSLIAGQVDIVGHDEPGARIEVHSVSGKELKISIVDDTLEIDHPQLGWDNWLEVFKSFRGTAKADISIMVPRDIELKLGVVSASGLVSGLNSEASINSVSGDVVIDGINGDIQLNSVSGELSVRNHYGKISAKTISGDIGATGELFGFTGDTVSGTVFLDIAGNPDEVKVSTVSGNVTARLVAGLPAQYKINTVSGRLQLDDSTITGVRGSYSGKYGILDKHWLEFKANTVSGNISVLHAVSV